jgi:hypothetical protein
MDMKSTFRPMTAGEILEAALAGKREDRPESDALGPDMSLASPPGIDHIEDLLATIVAGVLGVASVPRDLAFSALGGDSLTATRVLSRVWRAFEVKLPLSALVPDASVRMLTAAVKRARDANGPREAPFGRRMARGVEEASPNQAAIWFVQSQRGAGALYNIPHCLRLRGPLEAAVLRQSLERVVHLHEALRLRFELRDGRLLQEPSGERARFELPIVDLAETTRDAREEYALSLANAHIRIPFDLVHPPLLRALLIRFGREDHMLVLAIHHIVCDAWSIKLMMRQLGSGCAGVGDEVSHSAALGFLDFVAWQREALNEAEVARLASGWRQALGDTSETMSSLADHPRPKSPSGAGAIEPLELSAEMVRDLRRLSGDQGVTTYMTLLSAFATVLMHRTKVDCVVVGASVANRAQESLEEVVGYLANMLPLRVDCGGDPTMRELLCRVRAAALVAYDHQALPFAQLVRELAPPRRPGVNPLFQVAMILNDMSALSWGDTQVSEVTLHTGTAKLDPTCYLEERAGCLSGYLEYATELFLPETIRRLRVDFELTLGQMLDHMDQPISEVMAFLSSTVSEGEMIMSGYDRAASRGRS